jgi:O-antigen/teichoic acid export membrane protein
VVNLLGTESNAYFYVAWMIAGVLGAVTRAIAQSLFAEGSHSPESIAENVTRAIKFTIVLTLPAVILVAAAGKWILLGFGSEYSDNALGLLWLLAIATLPRGLVHVYGGLLRAQDRLAELLVVRAFIAVAVLTLSSLLMPTYGIISVGYVWLGVFVLTAIAVTPRLLSQSARSRPTREGEWEDVDSL